MVEDEPLAAKRLERLLKEIRSDLEISFVTGKCDEAKRFLEKYAPDVLFLDVNLIGCKAFELLEGLNYEPLVVFVTGYDEYALKAFEENAIDYVLKPVTLERLRKTLDKIERFGGMILSKVREVKGVIIGKLPIRSGDETILLDLDDVIYLVADGKRTVVVADEGEFVSNSTLKDLERFLPGDRFVRVHRSYVVSLKRVSRVRRWFSGGILLVMDNGDTVKVSRGYRGIVSKLLGI